MALLNFMKMRAAHGRADVGDPSWQEETAEHGASGAGRSRPAQSAALASLINSAQRHGPGDESTTVEQLSQSPKEGTDPMENNDNLPPAYPFAAADMDIDMIDKARTPTSNGTATTGQTIEGNPVEMARQVAVTMQDMVRRVRELEMMRSQFESRLTNYDDSLRAYESLKQTLRESMSVPVSDEDMQTLQRVLQALSQDPNHIMVLASVAQQAGKMATVVDAFAKIQGALKQAPPR